MPPKGKNTGKTPKGKKQGVSEAVDVAAKTPIIKTDGKGTRKIKALPWKVWEMCCQVQPRRSQRLFVVACSIAQRVTRSDRFDSKKTD
jgi:hypothetical protein